MAYIFADDVNFNYNLTSKLRHDNLITFPSLTAAEKGFVFFHTANNKFYGWTGSAWLDFSETGGGGGGDVFLAANQTFTGGNTFSAGIVVDNTVAFIKRAGNIVNASQGLAYFKTDNTFNISVGTGTGAHNATFAGIDSFTAARTFTYPDASGTLALEGAFVDLTTNQSIAGDKTFSGELNANTIVFTEVTSLPLQEGIGTLSSRLIFRDEATNQPFVFNGDNLTAIHTYTLPNADGTLALTSDIGGYYHSETTSYTTTGSSSEEAFSFVVPANTLANDGDTIVYEIHTLSSGVNAANVTLNVNFASSGVSSGSFDGVTGSLSFLTRGTILRLSATTYIHTVHHTVSNSDRPKISVGEKTTVSGNLGITGYTFSYSMTDSAGANGLKFVGAYFKLL